MKLLIIGATGQLGQALCNQAPTAGHTVLAPAFEEFDITNSEQMANYIDAQKPDYVVNTAAYNLVNDANTTPAPAFALNTVAVAVLARLCADRKLPFATYSTDYVFDGTKGSAYVETDQPHPLQVYGISKYAGEQACLNIHPDSLVIRTCGVYGGLTGSPVKGNIVLTFLKQAQEQTTMEVASEQTVIPTYAEDLASGTLQLIEKKAPGGLYHLVNEGQCTWAELAQKIVDVRKLSVTVTPVDRSGLPSPVERPKFSALQNTTAAGLGVKLRSWEEAVESYLQTLP